MSSRNSILLSGGVAAIVAVALVATIVFTGLLSPSGTTIGGAGTGTLSVLLTDPPVLPAGATALYVSYSDLQVHSSGQGNGSGWTDLRTSGSVNLTGVVNATQTVASAKLRSGSFDALRLAISSATVTYEGSNYSVVIPTQRATLYVPVVGGTIDLSSGQTAVSVVDVTPTVLLLPQGGQPSFELLPAAKAYALQGPLASSVHTHVGERDDVQSNPALRSLLENSRCAIAAAKLTPTSLSLTVVNTGNDSLTFGIVALSPLPGATTPTAAGPPTMMPAPTESELFAVEPNGSLLALTNPALAASFVAIGGYALPPKASVNFSYSGPITLGAVVMGAVGARQVLPEQNYLVRVAGSGAAAEAVVTAEA